MININKKFRILLDLDDTITDFMPTVIDYYNAIYNTNHTIDQITKWKIPPIFEYDLWSVFEKTSILERMPLKNNAKEIMKKWNNFGFETVIVTGINNPNNYVEKMVWFKNNELDLYVRDLIPTKNKDLINGDILVDDNIDFLRLWKYNHPNGIPILMTAQHNLRCDSEFLRVNSWIELDEVIMKYFYKFN